MFKIVSESGIGSGTRRIEAVTGKHAYLYMESQLQLLTESAGILKTRLQEIPERITQLQEKVKELSRENESLRAKLNQAAASELLGLVKEVSGIPVLAAQVEARDMEQLRLMVDDLRQKMSEGIIVLGTAQGEKVQLVTSVSKSYVKKGLHAGKLIKEIATYCGGGGGGRPDLAQAGGKKPDRLPEALGQVDEWIKAQL